MKQLWQVRLSIFWCWVGVALVAVGCAGKPDRYPRARGVQVQGKLVSNGQTLAFLPN
jgi:hypothetical protein